jgi:hypothetical protein
VLEELVAVEAADDREDGVDVRIGERGVKVIESRSHRRGREVVDDLSVVAEADSKVECAKTFVRPCTDVVIQDGE